MRSRSILLLAAIVVTGGCGGTRLYRPSPSLAVDPYDDREIDDEDVRRAFETEPQLELPVRVAYYALDDGHAEAIEEMLSGLPGVEGVYRLPALLVTGRSRLDEDGAPSGPVTVRGLRLLAAQARCDLLVVFDSGYRIERRPNGLAALNILLVPALFTPFVDADVASYLDAIVVDTRNGYIYGNTAAEEEGRRRWLTIWSREDEALVEEHWEGLLAGTRERLVELLAEPEAAEPAEGPARPEDEPAAEAASGAPPAGA